MTDRRTRFHDVIESAVARRGAALTGVCNVTPDSFSDGGRYLDETAARARVDTLLEEGADIVDIGGETTKPGSRPVPAKEQLARVLEVVRYAVKRGACVSIDTTSAEVAATCLDSGAHAVNDVSFLADEDLARVAGGSSAALVLSHCRAPQEKMSGFGGWHGSYGDVVNDVIADWQRAATRAVELGVPRSALVMDPGLGYSKTSRHSFEILRRAAVLVNAVDVPVLFGASRKSFLTLVDRDAAADARIGASIAAAMHAVRAGVRVVRVHDVRATRQALDVEVVVGSSRRKI